jgi:hypothetical protein
MNSRSPGAITLPARIKATTPRAVSFSGCERAEEIAAGRQNLRLHRADQLGRNGDPKNGDLVDNFCDILQNTQKPRHEVLAECPRHDETADVLKRNSQPLDTDVRGAT